MSVRVRVGEIYDCIDLREGESKSGAKWAFFKVKAKRGNDFINVWASNPNAIHGATSVKIVSQESSTLTHSFNGKTDKWYPVFNVTCTLERAESERQGAGSNFSNVPDDFSMMFGL